MKRFFLCLAFAIAANLCAADKFERESKFYRIETIPIPDGVVLEPGAIQVMPDGKVAVSTRLGDIYLIQGALGQKLDHVKFIKFASGLHEVLGLAIRDG